MTNFLRRIMLAVEKMAGTGLEVDISSIEDSVAIGDVNGFLAEVDPIRKALRVIDVSEVALSKISGSYTIAVDNTPEQLPNKALEVGVILMADPDNVQDLYIGDSGVDPTQMRLMAGLMVGAADDNVQKNYVYGKAGDIIRFFGG